MTDHRRPLRSTASEERFRALFARHYAAVYGYAARRIGRQDAADAAAEVFTVAWKKFGAVPDEPETLPWLYAVARRTVANAARTRRRRDRLEARAARLGPATEPPPTEPILDALGALGDADREILRLAAWEGLGPEGLGAALGCSSGTAAVRLHRARRRLGEALEALESGGHR